MAKYARIVDGRVLDLIDTDDYKTRPKWGKDGAEATDEDLINRIFEAVGGFAAFEAVPEYVQPYADAPLDGAFESDAAHEARLEVAAEAEAASDPKTQDPAP